MTAARAMLSRRAVLKLLGAGVVAAVVPLPAVAPVVEASPVVMIDDEYLFDPEGSLVTIRRAFLGFSAKIGNGSWQHVEVTLVEVGDGAYKHESVLINGQEVAPEAFDLFPITVCNMGDGDELGIVFDGGPPTRSS